MYRVSFSEKAWGQFKKLENLTQKRIFKVLERIKLRPQAHVKKLVGDPAYSLRVGNYRVILDINQRNLFILVLEVGHRRQIYK